MIKLKDIKSLYPDIQGFDRSVLREYLQYKILDIIFKTDIGSKLSFLGGTAIKICYGSLRFSEDLDFDNFGLTEKEFESLSAVIKRELALEGYEVEVKNVFKGAFRCYIKIPKLLFENQLADMEGEKITIQLDTAPHGVAYNPDKFLLQKFDVFRMIRLTPIDIILSQKVAAILGRKRAKGRDFYDVVYLMGQTDFNYDYLQKKLKIKNESELKKILLRAAPDNMKDLLRDVAPFLLRKDDQNTIILFKEYIEQKLK